MKRKLNPNLLIKFTALAICFLCLTSAAEAQKRRGTRTRATRPAAAIIPASIDIKAGAGKVSTQVKNVTKFIYVLGGIAQGIEGVDNDAKAGKASRAAIDQNTRNKQVVITSIRNLRAGLAALEIEFRTKPALRNYLFQIQGISDTSGTAEDQAAAGQFTQSGKTLLLVVEKLADTLAAMP